MFWILSIIGASLTITNNLLRSMFVSPGVPRGKIAGFLIPFSVFLAPFAFAGGFSLYALATAALLTLPLMINTVRSIIKIRKAVKQKKGGKVVASESVEKAVRKKENRINREKGRAEFLETLQSRRFFSGAVLGGVVSFFLDKTNQRIKVNELTIQDLYLQQGAAELAAKNIKSVADRYISFSEVILPDGRKCYEVGRDLKPVQIEELKTILANQLGVNVNDPELFIISRYTNSELGTKYGADRVAMFLDRKDGSLHNVGASLDDLTVVYKNGNRKSDLSVMEYIEKTNLAMHKKGLNDPKKVAEMGYPGGLHMAPLGKSAVALIMDGVVLAHAVAGEDGKIRLLGDDGLHGTSEQKRLVSRLNETLKNAGTMQDWCDMAKNIILSPQNISAINKGVTIKNNLISSIIERRHLRYRIINVPKQSMKSIRKSL